MLFLMLFNCPTLAGQPLRLHFIECNSAAPRRSHHHLNCKSGTHTIPALTTAVLVSNE